MNFTQSTRARRAIAVEKLIEQAKTDQRRARTIACHGVRRYADREATKEEALDGIEELARATRRLEVLLTMTVMDLEVDEP